MRTDRSSRDLRSSRHCRDIHMRMGIRNSRRSMDSRIQIRSQGPSRRHIHNRARTRSRHDIHHSRHDIHHSRRDSPSARAATIGAAVAATPISTCRAAAKTTADGTAPETTAAHSAAAATTTMEAATAASMTAAPLGETHSSSKYERDECDLQ